MNTFFKTKHFVILMALIMGLGAFSIDSILPAFPKIIQEYKINNENLIQQVVFFYLLGFASTQLFFGVLTDTFGRKKILASGLIIYILASILLIYATNYSIFLLARFIQGVGLSATRVISSAIIRDVSSGKEMAKTMSFITMIFMIIPVIAPTFGQIIISLKDWHFLLRFYVILGIVLFIWFYRVLPETLISENRRELSFSSIKDAFILCLKNKQTVIYLLMNAILYGMLASYIGQAELIFHRGVYSLGIYFPIIFALTAGGMMISSYLNTRLVIRMGMQKILNATLFLITIIDLLFLITTLLFSGKPPLVLTVVFIMIHLMLYNISMPNLNALIMENYQKAAGIISALAGSFMILFGVFIAQISASFFQNSLFPLTITFVICAIFALFGNIIVNFIKRT